MASAAPSPRDSVARLYDLFQTSFDTLHKERQYLNYGYTVSGRESYEDRQQRLCLETLDAAGLAPGHVVVDVGFGSGEQDFLLARTQPFDHLFGYNISRRQVDAATERARREGLSDRLTFRHGAAEELSGLAPGSIDRLMAIECAFYFDRPRFYARAAEVLKPGGRLVVADIAFADPAAPLLRWHDDFLRVGTRARNRAAWERHFRTLSVRDINRETRPGAQLTVLHILKTAPFSGFSAAEQREWMAMAFWSQLVALGLRVYALRYDLIVLEKP